jgi:putative glutamine amidotransferase
MAAIILAGGPPAKGHRATLGAMNPPLIGVSTSVTFDRYPERAYVNAAYLGAVQQAGGIPILLPPQLEPSGRAELVKRLQGVLLTGGGDIDPARFGEAPHPTTADVSAARDGLEIELTRWAIETRTPLLAICRGLQVLNVALGGSLHQDIPSEPGSPLDHSQVALLGSRGTAVHQVKVQDGSRLAGILGALEVDVNSFHHQAIHRLGRGLKDVAWAPDSIIEGMELVDDSRFAVGVQWHPEELVGHDRTARNLFRALVERARERQTAG